MWVVQSFTFEHLVCQVYQIKGTLFELYYSYQKLCGGYFVSTDMV